MPVDLFPAGKSRDCAITKDGIVNFPNAILEKLGWQVGDDIAVRYILDPMTLLFWVSKAGRAGFRLSYTNRSTKGNNGGKLSCTGFAKQYIRPRLPLPLINIQPAYMPKNSTYQLALLLHEPQWCCVEFSMTGLETITPGTVGVYELLGTGEQLLYVGEGDIQARMRDHLRKDHMVRLGRSFRFFAVDKPDAVVLEQVLMALHHYNHGTLPHFNMRR